MRRPILILRLLIGAAVVAVLIALFSTPEPGTSVPAVAPAERGGQIVGSMRSEPRSFNRLVARDYPSDMVFTLLHGRLVRVNRATFEVEPWLAERWDSSDDGLTHTFHLRPDLRWSDGQPFSSADVLFSLEAALDPRVASVVADSLMAGGKPIAATAPDANTVVVTFAGPSGPGVAMLDALPILPRHKLGEALAAGTLAKAWGPATPPSEMAGMGPFVLAEYAPGERLVLDRNPHFWRRDEAGVQLPYLDRIVLEVVPEQNAELLRLLSGATDFTHGELRPEDFVQARRAEREGKVTLLDVGVSTDSDILWFCMKPEAKRNDPRFAFVQRREFRQALSHAVDRERFAETVFLSEAVPVWGPVTPGNETWFSPNVPRYPHDLDRARELLKGIGLEDRNGNGIVEDARGTEARFTVITQRGITHFEQGTAFIRDQVKQVGVELEIAALDPPALFGRLEACNYDAIYMRPLMMSLDPAGNLDFWLSSGGTHLWNMSQKTPATEWEAQIDQIMLEQARTRDEGRRKELFDEAQRILGENVPLLYFAAPRMYYGHSARLGGVIPSVMRPFVLWNADMLSVTGGAAAER